MIVTDCNCILFDLQGLGGCSTIQSSVQCLHEFETWFRFQARQPLGTLITAWLCFSQVDGDQAPFVAAESAQESPSLLAF